MWPQSAANSNGPVLDLAAATIRVGGLEFGGIVSAQVPQDLPRALLELGRLRVPAEVGDDKKIALVARDAGPCWEPPSLARPFADSDGRFSSPALLRKTRRAFSK